MTTCTEQIEITKQAIEEQPEGETKEAMKGILKNLQDIEKLQAEYEALTEKEKGNLSESLQSFLGGKS